MNWKLTTLTAAVLAALAMTGAQAAADLEPYRHKAQVLQRLSSFDNPEGAIFSADGKVRIGAIGVSGEEPADDAQCAEAGIRAAGLRSSRP